MLHTHVWFATAQVDAATVVIKHVAYALSTSGNKQNGEGACAEHTAHLGRAAASTARSDIFRVSETKSFGVT